MFLTRLIKIFSTKCYILPLKTFSSIPTFKNFGLKSEILDALEQMNIHTPSPIQSQSISHLLKPLSENVYIAGQTGTGKTLAYLLPIMHLIKLKEGNVKNTVSNRPYAILLMPSKELVEQTLEICKKICHFLKLRTIGLSNIHPFNREKNGLDEGADIVVTTIDRLEKHRKKQNIFLSNVNYLVIDEADTFLDSGYKDSMEEYINILSKNNAKIIYVSATFTNPLNRFFESIYGKDSNYLKKIIEKKTHMNLSNLKHEFIHVKDLDKQTPLLKILKEFNALIESTKGATMIFCNSVPSCQSLEYRLKQEGFDCISLHGDIPKNIRIQNIRRFRTQEINILISTDLGARGLDFPFLNHVINFDFPKTTSDYLHRAGRAGRAGKKGYVTNLYHSKDNQVINELKESHENNSPVKIGGSAYM